MASKRTFPMMTWTSPLKREERAADKAADQHIFREPTVEDFLTVHDSWHPVLPPSEVPLCQVCSLPSSRHLCSGCAKLLPLYDKPLDSLDFLAISKRAEAPETNIWNWKEHACSARGVEHLPRIWLAETTKKLSTYLEAHRVRLLADDPLVTSIPSRVPLIQVLMQSAAADGALSIDVQHVADKNGAWLQHLLNQPERLSRVTADWAYHGPPLRGRPVLLLDDVFVTGASACSFAAVLKQAGASEVRFLAIARHMHDFNGDYWDALRIVRRTKEWVWSPNQNFVGRFPPGE
jgi:hypothetical protein